MRVAVTGATGNIGTATLRRLAPDGHHVVGLARRTPHEPIASEVEWREVDLTQDAAVSTLERAFAGADAVVHLAWGFQPSHDRRYLEELGVGGTRRVVQAASRVDVPHLIHMSSVGAYSPKSDDEPVDETWPTDGIPTSRYSRHKAAAERLLDEHERRHPTMTVTRFRPGIVGQRSAGSALLRYGLPAMVPAAVLGHVPVLPLDRGLVMPMVHADDVAEAIARELEAQAGGAFNLAAEPAITAHRIAEALGARLVHVPSGVLRPLMSAAWHARLQQVDTGWLDMGFAVPLLDSARARRELGWSPSVDAVSVLHEVLTGMRDRSAGPTPVLRSRSVRKAMADLVRRGPVGIRNRP